MRLELSLPDGLAVAAHRAATERGMSSSELFARAIAAFLKSHEVVHTEAPRLNQRRDPVWTQGWEPPG
jgi:hypothetical protein